MEPTLFRKIAGEILPRTSELFLSCGAEPLIARNLLDVLRVIGKAQVPFVAFTTNALLFNEENIREVVSSGVKEVYVSFDGATEGTFAKIRGGASIYRVMEKIKFINGVKRSLSATTPRIELHVTLMRSNIEELEGIIDIAGSLEIHRVTALHVYPFPQLHLEDESLFRHRDLYDDCVKAARERAFRLGIEFDSPPLFEKAAPAGACDLREDRNPACVLPWKSFVIWPNGNVLPCSFWYEGEPFGSLTESSFQKIWYGPRYQQLRESIRNNILGDNCIHCPALLADLRA